MVTTVKGGMVGCVCDGRGCGGALCFPVQDSFCPARMQDGRSLLQNTNAIFKLVEAGAVINLIKNEVMEGVWRCARICARRRVRVGRA